MANEKESKYLDTKQENTKSLYEIHLYYGDGQPAFDEYTDADNLREPSFMLVGRRFVGVFSLLGGVGWDPHEQIKYVTS